MKIYKDTSTEPIALKGRNILVTKENCMELFGWTEEQFNQMTTYAPYIPEFHSSIEPPVCVQLKQSEDYIISVL